MKKTTLFKNFLLAALLLGGAGSAEAGDVTTLYQRTVSGTASTAASDVSAAWSTKDIYNSGDAATTSGWTNVNSTSGVTASIDEGLKLIGVNSSKSQAFTFSKTINVSSNTSILHLTADWDYSKNRAGNSGDVTYYSFLKIGDVEVRFTGKDYKMITVCNGTEIQTETIGSNYFVSGSYANISVTVNQATKNVSYTITIYKNGSDANPLVKSNSGTTGNNVSYNLSIGYSKAGGGGSTTDVLKEIRVTEEDQELATYDYTVNYKEGETLVKRVTGSGYEGAAIPVVSATEAFLGDDMTASGGSNYSSQKFFIIADEVARQDITTDTENNVLDISVRRPYSTTLTVTRYFDGVAEATPYINGTALDEKENKEHKYLYYYPFYLKVGEIYYRAILKDGKFGETGDFTNDAVTKHVDYTTDPSVVAYVDGQGASSKSLSYSNYEKNAVDQNAELTIATSPSAGVYELSYQVTDNRTATLKYYIGESATELGSLKGIDTKVITLPEGVTKLIAVNTGQQMYYDYFVLRKGVAISTVDNLGYTFSSTLPLDFTGKNVEAYTATYDKEKSAVTLNRVYKVPANTGLFIKGSADDIPVLTGDADGVEWSSNVLKAVSTKETVSQTDGANTNYVLALADKNDESKGIVFLKADGTTKVAAGKAYLQIPTADAPATARLMVMFDDETTGIGASLVNSEEREVNSAVYDLQGRRVAQPTKGLYIVDGKKVIVK